VQVARKGDSDRPVGVGYYSNRGIRRDNRRRRVSVVTVHYPALVRIAVRVCRIAVSKAGVRSAGQADVQNIRQGPRGLLVYREPARVVGIEQVNILTLTPIRSVA